jgi:hypothetical protein
LIPKPYWPVRICRDAKNAIQNIKDDVSETTSGILTNGNITDARDQLLSAIGGAVDTSNQRPEFEADVVTEDTRLGKATEQSLDKVTLYMPTGIKNTDTLTYSEQDFGLMKGLLNAEIGSLIPGLASKAAGFVDSLAEISATDLNSEAALNAVTGAVRNPRKEQLFNDVGFRTFDFTFNLFPRSKKESHDVMEMIKLFRFHAHPEVTPNQAFYNMPSEFQITYIDLTYPSLNPFQQIGSFFGAEYSGVTARENQWLNKIGRCVLTNVGVEYTPQDRLAFFADGAPAMVTLTLTFAELEAINRNKVKIGY